MFTLDEIKKAKPEAQKVMLAQNDEMYFSKPIAQITQQILNVCKRVEFNRISAKAQRQRENRADAEQLVEMAKRLLVKPNN